MIEWRWFDLEATIYDSALSPKGGRIPVPQRAVSALNLIQMSSGSIG
jgi:hypothetical protein